jgi:hypothetical protein
MIRAKDNRVSSRVTQKMTQIKNFDTTSVRGQRNVATGLTPEGKATLKGLDFNNRAIFKCCIVRSVYCRLCNWRNYYSKFNACK